MLPKGKRLSRKGFDALIGARRFSSDHFSILHKENTLFSGSAVVIAKKVATKSVNRHKLKRQIRAILSEWTTPGRAMVVYLRPGANGLAFSELENELSTLLRSILG
jgi:ribonuclease P protein component